MIFGCPIIILSKKRGRLKGLFYTFYLHSNLKLVHIIQFSDNCIIFHNTDKPYGQNQSMVTHPACWLS